VLAQRVLYPIPFEGRRGEGAGRPPQIRFPYPAETRSSSLAR
jgi:hypothetical protein